MIAPIHFDSSLYPFGALFRPRSRQVPVRAQPSIGFCTVHDLSIVKLCGETPPSKQRRRVRQWVQRLPSDQRRVVLDVSVVPDDCTDLVGLITTVLAEANRCRLKVVLAGVSLPKAALLELTRVSHVVPCYADAADAISGLLDSNSRERIGVA